MNKPYTFAQRLKMLIDQRGISRSELARICGISKSNVTRYINGEYEAKQDVVYRMASSLGVSEAWLMGHDVPMERTPSPAPAAREIDPIYDALNPDGQKELCRYGRYLTAQDEYRRVEAQPQIVRIRHYLVPAAAGYAAPIEGEDYEDIPLPAGAPANADFCITIRGDSMEPYIHDGDLAYVKRDAPMKEFEPGIFFVDGDVLCKQWCIDYIGTLHLLSANPNREDANRAIPKSSTSSVVCFGKVLLKQKLPQPIYR